MYSVHKFRDLAEMQNYLNGGLLGADVGSGVVGLVGTTLTFTSPSGSVTFVEGALPDHRLMFNDIKQQIEAAVNGVRVYQIGGHIALVHSSDPVSVPIALDSAPSDAKRLLGFPYDSAATGRIIGAPGSTSAPRLVWWNTTNDGSHAVMIWEG
jgi:hypothetical protein